MAKVMTRDMDRHFWRKILITAGAALAGAVLNLFPVSLFFGADFLLGGIVAQAPAILFGPGWGALSAGLATLPTLAYWRDPYFPFLIALLGGLMGFWVRRHRSRVVEGALLTGLFVGGPIAAPLYLASWSLPVSGVLMITAKVIVNFMLDVILASHLLRVSGLEARLNPHASHRWDMRAHLANLLSLVVFLILGGVTVFFGNAEYGRVQDRAAEDVRLLADGARRDLAHRLAAAEAHLDALAASIPMDVGRAELERRLALFSTLNPEFSKLELVAPDGALLASSPARSQGSGSPGLALDHPIRSDSGSDLARVRAVIDPASLDLIGSVGGQGQILVLDPAGNVVKGPAGWSTGSPWRITDLGVPAPGFGGLTVVLPETRESSLVQWQNGHLVYEGEADRSGWRTVAVMPLAPYQARLFTAYEIILLAWLGLMIPFLWTIHGISSWLTRPLEQVAATARSRLLGDTKARWPEPDRIAELNLLVSHLQETESALATARAELLTRNAALEEANRNLERLAAVDPLTGLANRRTLDQTLEQELRRARRNRRSSALLMIDLDHFKAVNDTYGHPAGDVALHAVAWTIESCRRPADLVARYGGEELAVVLFDVDRNGAREVAERIRATVAETPVSTPAGPFSLTVSIGIAILPDDGETLLSVVEAADSALYKAKAAGRNQVFLYAPEHRRPPTRPPSQR